MQRSRKIYASVGSLLAVSSLAVAGSFVGSASAGSDQVSASGRVERSTQLNPLNNSGVRGHAETFVQHRHIFVDIDARGLAKGLPHAQHIHFGADARHECPTVADDRNGDFRLNTTDGAKAYGPIRVSLTTRGRTGPKSGLAVNRFPTAPHGKEHYDRWTTAPRAVARAIKRGEGVIVIHGVDYNDNGKYDFRGAGKSDLDPKLPAEATDPAVCGVLR